MALSTAVCGTTKLFLNLTNISIVAVVALGQTLTCDLCFLPPGGAGGSSSKLSADDELIQLCVGQQYKGYTSDTVTTVCLVWGHSSVT